VVFKQLALISAVFACMVYAQSDYSVDLPGLASGAKSLEMVYVKGGSFQRGCSTGDTHCENTEKPVHKVTLSDYYIGKYELTQAQWKAVMGSSGSSNSFPGMGNTNDVPQTNITWYDAVAFTCELNKITGKKYRLLTDAEFEFAARGGTLSKGYLYSGSDNPDLVAWHSGNSSGGFGGKAVGGLAGNELGIYDMSGNVYEWTWDNWGNYASSASDLVDPTTTHKHTQKVRRGGSHDQPASESRVSARKIRSIEGKDGSIGLRLAISASGSFPTGFEDPCSIHQPEPSGGPKGFKDTRLITGDDYVWVSTGGYGETFKIGENGAVVKPAFFGSNVSGEWFTLNSFSFNVVSSSGTVTKYIYYLIDNENMSLMPEGGMPDRYEKRLASEVSGASGMTLPTIANPKSPEQLAPAGYNVDMANPPTTGRDPRLIDGKDSAWLQDNVKLGAGGTHRYRFDFDDETEARFVVWDPPGSTGLARGTWFTVDNNFLRISYNGKNNDYLYTVTPDGKTYYHISYQGYEPGDFRMFEKVKASEVPAWIEPTMYPYENMDNGSSTYIPPSDLTSLMPVSLSHFDRIQPIQNGLSIQVSKASVSVFDLQGKLLSQKVYGAGSHLISLANLPKGNYFVRVHTKAYVKNFKVSVSSK